MTRISWGRRAGIVAAVFALAVGGASVASAAISFTIDASKSSVEITDQTSGFFCSWTNCEVDAKLALTDGETFSLETGESHEFDFIEWSGIGTGTFGYSVTATLAFSTPLGANTTSGGGGFGAVFNGFIKFGSVYWDDVPAF